MFPNQYGYYPIFNEGDTPITSLSPISPVAQICSRCAMVTVQIGKLLAEESNYIYIYKGGGLI